MPENQFPIGQRINLPGHFPEPVVLEAVRAIGDGFECRVRLADGTPDETILSREEADTLLGQRADTPISVPPVDAEKFRLLVESARIRLAYAYDKHFAVSLSGIRTLPHQIEAVYLKMLPQPRLRSRWKKRILSSNVSELLKDSRLGTHHVVRTLTAFHDSWFFFLSKDGIASKWSITPSIAP